MGEAAVRRADVGELDAKAELDRDAETRDAHLGLGRQHGLDGLRPQELGVAVAALVGQRQEQADVLARDGHDAAGREVGEVDGGRLHQHVAQRRIAGRIAIGDLGAHVRRRLHRRELSRGHA